MFCSLNHFKSVFTHQFFVGPADSNYFVARWARVNGFPEEFYWQALQALEKYFKAGLLLNGVCIKPYGHDLNALLEKHLDVYDCLAVSKLIKPLSLRDDLWGDEEIASYIQNINSQGHPDIRYGLRSWSSRPDDLFKFDQLAFSLRRLTIGVDWLVGADWKQHDLTEFEGQPYREVLKEKKDYQVRAIEVPKGSALRAGMGLSDVWHCWNYAYRRSEEDLTKPAPSTVVPRLGPFANSYLYLLHRMLQKDTKKSEPNLREGVEWLLANVKLHNEVQRTFRALLDS